MAYEKVLLHVVPSPPTPIRTAQEAEAYDTDSHEHADFDQVMTSRGRQARC